MTNPHDLDWLIAPDYCGTILRGNYSHELKRKVAEYISQFRSMDHANNPSIPYISAWLEGDQVIWYEFVGTRLSQLLGCHYKETARIFADRIIKHCIYHCNENKKNISQKTIQGSELIVKRQELRELSKESGTVEAIYKIGLENDKMIWLKDQARTKCFSDDNICISLGGLTCVTREMKAAEQSHKAEGKLEKERDRLEQLLKKQAKEIWKTQLEIIYRLAKATELHDQQTGSHLSKMSHYCNIMARAAGLSDQERNLLFHAASMHDVGKIGISEKILQKKGPLTSEEFELMKSHSIIGAKLLSGNESALLEMAKSLALNHHEKWDGSGYPNGLNKEEIPLSGRIAAICDVFDALTSDRPYKKAWSTDDAICELHRGKGRHFDPTLVDLFLKNIPDIMAVQDRFAA